MLEQGFWVNQVRGGNRFFVHCPEVIINPTSSHPSAHQTITFHEEARKMCVKIICRNNFFNNVCPQGPGSTVIPATWVVETGRLPFKARLGKKM
jgi:hypothetical protein